MESLTRQVTRVQCWHHNVVVLECYEGTPSDPKFSHHHTVTMFTPTPVPLTLVEDKDVGSVYN